MAASADSINRMVNVMGIFGIPVDPSHKIGEDDPAFKVAYSNAMSKVLAVTAEPNAAPASFNGSLTPEQFQKLQTGLSGFANSESAKAIRAYANGDGYWSSGIRVSGDTLRDKIVAGSKGVLTKEMLNGPDAAKKILATLENPTQLLAAVKDIEMARNPSAWTSVSVNPAPASAAAAATTTTTAPPPTTTTTTTTTQPPAAATAGQDEALKKIVQEIQKRYLGEPNGTGEFTQAVNDKLVAYIKDLQTKAKDAGTWNGPVDGSYPPAQNRFRDEILNNSKEHGTFAILMDRFFANGGRLGAFTPAPAATATAGSSSTQGSGQSNAPLPPLDNTPIPPETASQVIEGFLGEVVPAVNKRAADLKAKGGLFGALLIKTGEVPMPGTVDGVFDDASKKSLQSVLKAFQLPLGLSEEEVINYTPGVGEKIRKNFPKIAQSLSEEQKKKLNEIGGIDTIVRSLNTLQSQLATQKIYEGEPGIKLSGFGAKILTTIFQLASKFLGRFIPDINGMMDGMLRQWTGGLGYDDLVESDQRDAEISKAAAVYANLPPEEQLQKTYANSLKAALEAAGPNASPDEIKKQLNQHLSAGFKAFTTFLPFNDPETAKIYEAAYEQAFAVAITIPDPDEAAKAYARTFLSKWDSSRVLDPATGQPRLGGGGSTSPQIDPSVNTFVADGHDMNSIKSTYETWSAMQAKHYQTARPMVFSRSDNTLWVAGMLDNKFTVQQMTPEALAALKTAAGDANQETSEINMFHASKADQKLTVLTLLAGNYGQYMTPKQMLEQLQNPKNFPDLKNYIYHTASELDAQVEIAQRNRQTDEAARRQNAQVYGDPTQHPGVDQQALRNAQNSQGQGRMTGQQASNAIAYNMERIYRLHAATEMPQVVLSEFEKGGKRRIKVETYEDPTGFAEAYTTASRGDKNAAYREEFFGVRPIDEDFWNFRKDLNAYIKARGSELKNMNLEQQLEEFQRFRGHKFSEAYPNMTAITRLPGYRGSLIENNIAALYKSIDTAVTPYVGSGSAPQIVSYASSAAGEPASGKATGGSPAYRWHDNNSWNPLYQLFNRGARRRAGYEDELPSVEDDDNNRSRRRGNDDRQAQENTKLDPNRPIDRAPSLNKEGECAPEAENCAANAGELFPQAARDGASSTNGSSPAMFRDNIESTTTRTGTPPVDPDSLFPEIKRSGGPGAGATR